MNETTETTAPQFAYVRTPIPSDLLREPLPPELWETLPAAKRKAHEKLVAEVEQAGRESARLRAELDGAAAADRKALAEAVRAGGERPEPSDARIRRELEQAELLDGASQDALAASADDLLPLAVAKAGALADELERQLGDRTADVRAALADLQRAVGELDQLYATAAWVRWLAEAGEGARVGPFRAGRGSTFFGATNGELTTTLAAFADDVGRIEKHRRAAADERRHRRKVDAQWARERAGGGSER
jgi:hypothetical protein